MSNDYKEEFDEVVNIGTFHNWVRRNSNYFYMNMLFNEKNHSIREWMKMFLAWSEYTENQGEKDGAENV